MKYNDRVPSNASDDAIPPMKTNGLECDRDNADVTKSAARIEMNVSRAATEATRQFDLVVFFIVCLTYVYQKFLVAVRPLLLATDKCEGKRYVKLQNKAHNAYSSIID